MDERTKTKPLASQEQASGLCLWKLRVLYAGAEGISNAEVRGWDGKTPLTLGRRTATLPNGSWLLLDDEMTSRNHAKLSVEGQRPILEDLDSKNGTLVNGHRLRPSERWEISDGDLLGIGDSLLLIRYEPAIVRDVHHSPLVGVSATMRKVRCDLAHAARTENPVLILGETGTGKGVVASAIHQRSGRQGKLVEVNCAATPATLAEGMFFGTQRGAFTGAVAQGGFFQESDHGTLFLDEIGDFPVEIQVKLLRAIETRQVIPLGSTRPIACDVRILAATNRDLDAARRELSFREDLYARLSATVLRLPPLRQRREDILLLAQHVAGSGFRPSVRLATAMLRYDWPHNVREIGNIIQQLDANGEEVMCKRLEAASAVSRALPSSEESLGVPLLALLNHGKSDQTEDRAVLPSKRQLITLLEKHQGNLSDVARATGRSRRQLLRWIQSYGLDLALYRNRSPRS